MCACNQLRRASRAITQLYDGAMAGSGLKVTQLPILVGLGTAGELSISALADALALDRTTLTRNLSVLEGRGLVSTRESADDARVRIVSLTPDGSRMLSAALARWREMHGAVEERFGRDRLRALYDELDALGAAIAA
jgi:DNA-binding MarR family transcriptional regulator